jgi:hypothetical protein
VTLARLHVPSLGLFVRFKLNFHVTCAADGIRRGSAQMMRLVDAKEEVKKVKHAERVQGDAARAHARNSATIFDHAAR